MGAFARARFSRRRHRSRRQRPAAAVAGARSRHHVRRRSVHARHRLGLSRAERRRALDAARAGAARAGRRHAGGARRGRLGDRHGRRASQRRAPRHGLRDARTGRTRCTSRSRGSSPRATTGTASRAAARRARSAARARPRRAARCRVASTLAVASCQHYEQGHYAAYRAIAADALDLVVHVGDYIYEDRGTSRVRTHDAARVLHARGLSPRYALYKSDPHLKAAHAAAPGCSSSDDHEVANDYAAEHSGQDDPPRAVPRAARGRLSGVLRAPAVAAPAHAVRRRISGSTRAAASAISSTSSCSTAVNTARRTPAAGAARRAVRRALCERALDARRRAGALAARRRSAASRARWNLLGQQTLFAHFDQSGDGPLRLLGRRLERLSGRARAARRASRAAPDREPRRLERRHPRVPRQRRATRGREDLRLADRRDRARHELDQLARAAAGDVRSLARRESERALARSDQRGYLRSRSSPSSLHADLVAVDDVDARGLGDARARIVRCRRRQTGSRALHEPP